jgi:HAD superfamily hydrolase (TIGR01549 family)
MNDTTVMNRKLNEYKALVFDLDGTLYYQRQLRLKMAWMLGSYYLCHFWRIKELLVIKRFREIREHWDELSEISDNSAHAPDEGKSLEEAQYAYVAKVMNCTPEMVRSTVETWMYEKPLKAVYDTRDEELLEIIRAKRAAGQKIIIWSDYPIEDKLRSLGIEADGMYAATDKRVGALKPDPRGLELIMEDYGLRPDEILVIGDRMEKDAEAAKRAGCDRVVLPKDKRNREKLYKSIL